MKTKTYKMAVGILAIFLLNFLISTSIARAQEAAGQYLAKLPSGKEIAMTAEQLEAMKAQPGITFYQELPAELPEGQVSTSVPSELGGGYLVGTPESLASGLNATGITVGADEDFVKGGLAAWVPIAGAAAAAAAAGGVVAGVTGAGGGPAAHAPPAHAPAAHH